MNRTTSRSGIRWRPAVGILLLTILADTVIHNWSSAQFQMRNIVILAVTLFALLLLTIWWLFFSGATLRGRGLGVAGALAVAGLFFAAFRVHGVTGDFVPVIQMRWAKPTPPPVPVAPPSAIASDLDHSGRPDFPQYLGPHRNCIIDDGTALARDWQAQPPQLLWRRPIATAWSGFSIVGNRALTMEQRGDDEVVSCSDALTGKELWTHAYPAHYNSSLGGEGPRATPTVDQRRVYTFGGTGVVNCLDLASGQVLWHREMAVDAPKGRPEWGYAGSPLVFDGKVYISAGQSHEQSTFAYRTSDGQVVWRNGSQPAEYSSPCILTLAGVPQLVMFNMIKITSHDPQTGNILWEYPWGVRQPVIAQPTPVGPDRVVFSSSYGVGSECLEIKRAADGTLTPERVWKSIALRAKISSFIFRNGFLYGLDDGILACIDASDGSRKWKAGRYGHGQLLLVGDLLLVTAESGEIYLLAPTPEAPNELTHFRVFPGKTWNPPALSGDVLLMRTDTEAACLRLPLAHH